MPRFRMKDKVGPHRHIDGKWYEPGNVLVCEEHEIRGARDKFEMIEEPERTKSTPQEPPEEDKEIEPGPEAEGKEMEEEENDSVGLVLQHKGGGRYNVVNPATGDKINDEYLTKTDAESLVRGKP